MPVALRTVADAVGGMAALAQRTGLSQETLYRTLSEKGNPRLDTLSAILCAFVVAACSSACDETQQPLADASRRLSDTEAE